MSFRRDPALALLVLVTAAATGYTLGVARGRETRTSSSPAASTCAPPGEPPTLPSAAPLAPAPLVASSAAPSSSEASSFARLKALEAKPARERTIEESLALARGHERLAADEVASLETALVAAPTDALTLGRLRALALDDAVAPDVLVALARHPSAAAVDAVRDVATDASASETVRYLADDLLAAPDVRRAASKELAIALDLEAARDCDAVKRLVERARGGADDRALPRLRALEQERGCGRDGKGDCFPCLRGDTLLYEAREAAAKRSFVAPWRGSAR